MHYCPHSPVIFNSSNTSPTRMRPFAVCAVVMVSTFLSPRSCATTTSSAFSIDSYPSNRPRQRGDAIEFGKSASKSSSLELFRSNPSDHSPLEDSPWSGEDSYYDRLREASKDPIAFEKFVEESTSSGRDDGGGGGEKSSTVSSSSSSSSSVAMKGVKDVDGNDVARAPKKYVPIEEWDAGRKNGENMTKEERLQWECQRNGDQFKQNEILMRNLKRF
ncbi:hypothetical protein ACHAXA_010805 [Cyclostephanos tholiformis]|uniref:Uncharacterized protein n=1 Tax=Cyclostephanos tholiformis TaxID=382380 RepID=A0ABD3R5R5_9STRA